MVGTVYRGAIGGCRRGDHGGLKRWRNGMRDQDKLNRLWEEFHKWFVRCTFPNGRDAYMREFEEKFETSVNNMKLGGGINREPNPYWKTHG